MNVVDSSGWLEYFAPVIEDTEQLIVPAICLYEVFKRLLEQIGEREALVNIGDMHQEQIAELTAPIALEAAKLSIDLKLAMADSMILTTAHAYNATLWT